MYSLGLRVRRFVSEVLSDRDFGRMYEIRSGRDLASFASGGRTSCRSIFCHPGLCHDGCARMAGQRKSMKKTQFFGGFRGEIARGFAWDLLSLRVALVLAFFVPASSPLSLSIASLAPSIQIRI